MSKLVSDFYFFVFFFVLFFILNVFHSSGDPVSHSISFVNLSLFCAAVFCWLEKTFLLCELFLWATPTSMLWCFLFRGGVFSFFFFWTLFFSVSFPLFSAYFLFLYSLNIVFYHVTPISSFRFPFPPNSIIFSRARFSILGRSEFSCTTLKLRSDVIF